jgi:hypothetical protein
VDLTPYPNVLAYMARLAERPACAGARAPDAAADTRSVQGRGWHAHRRCSCRGPAPPGRCGGETPRRSLAPPAAATVAARATAKKVEGTGAGEPAPAKAAANAA